MSTTRRIVKHVTVVLGIALLIIAVAVPLFLVPKLKVIPLSISSRTTTETKQAVLLSSKNFAAKEPVASKANNPACATTPTPQEGEQAEQAEQTEQAPKDLPLSCFIDQTVRIYSTKYTRAVQPSTDEEVTLQGASVLMRATDSDTEASKQAAADDAEAESKNLVSAGIDRFTLDRRTAYPVKAPVSTLVLNAPHDGIQDTTAPFVRDGLQVQFPFGTQKQSYPFFDSYLAGSAPIDFYRESKEKGTTVAKDGLDVYEFKQDLGPVDLYETQKKLLELDGSLSDADKSTLASYRLKLPGRVWGLDTDDDVEMDRYYVNTRVMVVEPTTGMVVNGHEKVWMFYAKDVDEAKEIAANKEQEIANPKRTALYFEGDLDSKTLDQQLASAIASKQKLQLLTNLPWYTGIAGIILLGIAFWLHVSERRRAAQG